MKKQGFFSKLKKEGKLTLIEPSEEISDSYLEKAKNSLASAKILLEHRLYENSVSLSYYAMYNSLLALLFKTGIKSENHNASILLLKLLFKRNDLFNTISAAKNLRIDAQYYVTSSGEINKNSVKEMILKAEKFIIQVKLLISTLTLEETEKIREKFAELLNR
ncbi:MAG: HEPN domain-containing protein [Candidatus Diapherotrites archaeon]|nr:HEPN domain-containing protein [Candidatus Diapherotrites archaeon]